MIELELFKVIFKVMNEKLKIKLLKKCKIDFCYYKKIKKIIDQCINIQLEVSAKQNNEFW